MAVSDYEQAQERNAYSHLALCLDSKPIDSKSQEIIWSHSGSSEIQWLDGGRKRENWKQSGGWI